MEAPNDNLLAHKHQLVEMLLSIKDEALLLQIEHIMRAAGVPPSREVRTAADLAQRFQNAPAQIAAGRYKTAEQLLDEVKGWK